MRHRLLITLTVFAGVAAAQPPEDLSAFIEQVRQQALAYDDSLPNFICTQETERSSSKPGTDDWKVLDTLTIRLSYFGKKEDYRVTQVNGKPTDKSFSQIGGWKTVGDFGSMLRAVFREKSRAKFEWNRWDMWNGRKVAVMNYRIDKEHSGFNTNTHAFLHTNHTAWAAVGTVFADAENHQVFRLTVDSVEVPATDPVREVHIALDYAFQKIGDREYLLPAKSVSIMVFKSDRKKSEAHFTGYRKFSADAAITFGEAKL
jgi:hypothetical protein